MLKRVGQFLYFLLIQPLFCKHEPGPWEMVNMGMEKKRFCKKCGKIVEST